MPVARARLRCRRSSMSARRGSSGWPRCTRSCSATTFEIESRCVPTVASRPGGTCSSLPCWAPRSSRSGRRRSSRSAVTWPVSATSTRARPASPPSARTCAPSSGARLRWSRRFFLAIAEDLRRELAAIGARSVGEVVGESRRASAAEPARDPRAASRGRCDAVGCGRRATRGSVATGADGPACAVVAARGPDRRRIPGPGSGHGLGLAAVDGRSLVRRRPDRIDRAGRAPRASPARAARRGGSVVRGIRRRRRST